jgi:TolB protein
MRYSAILVLLLVPMASATGLQQRRPPAPLQLKITSGPAPRVVVPDFVAAGGDANALEFARTTATVLWDDLNYEREFAPLPRDTYSAIPDATDDTQPPLERWRALGADGVMMGKVDVTSDPARVEVRFYDIRSGEQVFGREYSGANPRLIAHTISDDIHLSLRNLRGVARTRLAFASDRDDMPAPAGGFKDIYIADYDGENQRRITEGKQLNTAPAWSPDGRGIAYTSWRRGFVDVFVSRIYEGTLLNPSNGTENAQNMLPRYSPDGGHIAFSSNRDGNWEIYVMRSDGAYLRRITNHPGNDVSPSWSPSGTQIAFTSGRAGTPSIYIVGVDGLGLRRVTFENSDRAAWSPSRRNEIAYTARAGSIYNIKVLDLATGRVRALTFGEGSNETPSWAPNGRHLAFWSTRTGSAQIFTVDADGKNVRQVTRSGNNQQPNWSQ